MTEKTYTETEVRALVAAALQRAAEVCDDLAVGYAKHKGVPDALHDAARDVLALIGTDHAGALEAVKAQAREEALEWAADHVEGYASPELSMMADAIRAGKVQP